MQHSVRYIVMFAAAVCVVCSIFVSSAAVLLKERQEDNKVLDQQKKVLGVAGLMEEGEKLSPEEIRSRFSKSIKAVVIDRKTGAVDDKVDAATFDQQAAKRDPEQSTQAEPNAAKVLHLPNKVLVYRLEKDGALETLIFPIEGKGLWSTLYGFLALDKDLQTIRGITFYQHGETPGLGGEVDNPRWKALWPGRKAFDGSGQPKISVKKGQAGTVKEDPYHVDGLSGATITSRGVTHLVQYWLGDNGYGPFIKTQKSGAKPTKRTRRPRPKRGARKLPGVRKAPRPRKNLQPQLPGGHPKLKPLERKAPLGASTVRRKPAPATGAPVKAKRLPVAKPPAAKPTPPKPAEGSPQK